MPNAAFVQFLLNAMGPPVGRGATNTAPILTPQPNRGPQGTPPLINPTRGPVSPSPLINPIARELPKLRGFPMQGPQLPGLTGFPDLGPISSPPLKRDVEAIEEDEDFFDIDDEEGSFNEVDEENAITDSVGMGGSHPGSQVGDALVGEARRLTQWVLDNMTERERHQLFADSEVVPMSDRRRSLENIPVMRSDPNEDPLSEQDRESGEVERSGEVAREKPKIQSFKLKNKKTGAHFGDFNVRTSGSVAKVDFIGGAPEEDEGGEFREGGLGRRDASNIIGQFLVNNPQIATIEGRRITGAIGKGKFLGQEVVRKMSTVNGSKLVVDANKARAVYLRFRKKKVKGSSISFTKLLPGTKAFKENARRASHWHVAPASQSTIQQAVERHRAQLAGQDPAAARRTLERLAVENPFDTVGEARARLRAQGLDLDGNPLDLEGNPTVREARDRHGRPLP